MSKLDEIFSNLQVKAYNQKCLYKDDLEFAEERIKNLITSLQAEALLNGKDFNELVEQL